jgi:hypothetical protein
MTLKYAYFSIFLILLEQFQCSVLDEAMKLPISLYPSSHKMPLLKESTLGARHNPSTREAIFTVYFPHHPFAYHNIGPFLMSARHVCKNADIVLAVPSDSPQFFVDTLNSYNVVLYLLSVQKITTKKSITAFHFSDLPEETAMPLAQLRYYLYQYWAFKYESETAILVSDFRDVFFQSDPFKYRSELYMNKGNMK